MSTVRAVAIAACVALIGSAAAFAQQQNVNVRGTISAFDGKMLSIKLKAGGDVSVELPEAANVATTKAFGMNDIKPGMVLGVTTIKGADGTVVAVDVRPIPPTATLGLTPHDLAPDSTMTNATVEGVVAAVKEVGLKVPLVVRLEGTNVDLGKKIIAESKLNVTSGDDLDDAAQKIVKAVKGDA